MTTKDFSEDALVEQPTIALFAELGWQPAVCLFETADHCPFTQRETTAEVVLRARLRPALEKLNPGLPADAYDQAIEQLTQDRSIMSVSQANRAVYGLLKEGVRVLVQDDAGEEQVTTLRVIDWQQPLRNDFFLVSQLWVSSDLYKRRADLVGFVNGLPLLFVELKAAHKNLKNAFDQNLKDYKDTIPHLFWYNAFAILSNGSHSVLGAWSSHWEQFTDWKKINSEGEQGVISLETMVRGTCQPERFLDIVENFILYEEAQGGLAKLVGRNHQVLGVNNAIAAVEQIEANHGRLGVFWHTQGSGKSYSMIFFSQKILRTVPGNWTFVVVTDRTDLDDQLYKKFANTGAVIEPEDQVRAGSGEHLRQLLREDHRYVFTMIHKFHSRDGEPMPVLSERSDIVVISDEAHRSQYDILADNMRRALPNAAFIGFTGTPLMVGEEKTRAVFGDYVSIYNFKQSVDDNATVALFYESRIPEVQLTNEDLNADMERLLEEAELDADQERKLERLFARQYHIITRDDRLEKIAEDLVLHFLGRGYLGKAMFVAIDRVTAVTMYDKVQKHWARQLDRVEAELSRLHPYDRERREQLERLAAYLRESDMAVVISQSQGEIDEFRDKGLDIVPHRTRLVKEQLDVKFKDPTNPLRIVFVCAMWITGFDAPVCSTIYLDKPMRNHTLMQTIARANRVFGEKNNGLIVDYIGVFRELEQALAIYGSASGGGVEEGDLPVKDKRALKDELQQAIDETQAFLATHGVDLSAIQQAEGYARIALLDQAVEAILVNDDEKRRYLAMATVVDRLFKAILPDPEAGRYGLTRKAIVVIAEKIRSITPDVDISEVMAQVEALLNESVAAVPYVIAKPPPDPLGVTLAETIAEGDHIVDLTKIDFAALARQFAEGKKRTEAEKLRGSVNVMLARMVRLNKTRMDYLERFQELIDVYNAGAASVDMFFANLVAFARELNAEEQRHMAEKLSEEELAVLDLLTAPTLALSKDEREAVKQIARELLATLKREQKLVLDWRKYQRTRADVRLTIEQVLDRLPQRYSQQQYQVACDSVYQHIYDKYYSAERSVYALAA